MSKKSRVFLTLLFSGVFMFSSLSVFADNKNTELETKYYLGTVVNTGTDNGYSETKILTNKDSHYGWTLGSFYVSGYTRQTTDDDNNTEFLKNVGDKVSLIFSLEQNIDQLNGNEKLSISDDKNGFDQYFQTEKTDFGRGALIIKHTDFQNKAGTPQIYTNYLSAKEVGADTQVELCEEGDYEVALDYEVKNDPRNLFGLSIVPEYSNYRIFFKFSVRNGNCMVFPIDVKTGEELTNSSITENGFYIDLANSQYLLIDVEKQILNDGVDGLIEDTRFNRPGNDGEPFVDEGIYIITVSNRFTKQQTEKKIYVGTNEILKAHIITNLSIAEIKDKIAKGATINSDGTINDPPEVTTVQPEANAKETASTTTCSVTEETAIPVNSEVIDDKKSSVIFIIVIIVAAIIIAIIICIALFMRNRKPPAVIVIKDKGQIEDKEDNDK